MISIIDIGSNTVRMNVYHENDSGFRLLFSSKEMAGLVAQIEDNCLLESGLQNLIRILKIFKDTIDTLNIKQVYPFATASLRNIDNRDEVLEKIKQETEFEIDLIDGVEEGNLGVIGALDFQPFTKAVLIDLGGGSCEIVPFENEKVIASDSYPIGSLSMYKTFVSELLPTKSERKQIKSFVCETIDSKKIKKADFKTVIGVGGTMRAILKIQHYLDETTKNTNELKLGNLKKLLKQLGDGTKEAQDIILKVVPDRIHTLLPGLMAIITLLEELGSTQILVSKNGVREGYLIKNVLKGGTKT